MADLRRLLAAARQKAAEAKAAMPADLEEPAAAIPMPDREAEHQPQLVPPPPDPAPAEASWSPHAVRRDEMDIEALEEEEAAHVAARTANEDVATVTIDTLAPEAAKRIQPTVVIQIPAPRPLQRPVLDDEVRFKVVRAGRRVGKTRLEFIAAVRGHGPIKYDDAGIAIGRRWKGMAQGGDICWIAPDYGQADAIWEEEILPRFDGKAGITISEKHKLVGFGRQLGIDRRGEPVYRGSLRLRSAENINSVRGKKFDGIIVDEAAFLKLFHAWRRVLRPTLIDRKGWAIIASTTDIGSDFNALAISVENKKRGPNWKAWHFRTYDNPFIDEEERAELAVDYPPGSPEEQQELGAELLESLGTLFRLDFFHHYTAASREAVWIGNLRYPFQYLVMTVDLASSLKQTADFTCITIAGVCWPVDGVQRVAILDVHNERLEGPAQIEAMELLAKRWRPAYIDIEKVQYQETAVQHLEPKLQHMGLIIEGVTVNKDKRTRAVPAAGAMARQEWYFPAMPDPVAGTGAQFMPDVRAQLLKFPNGKEDSKFVEDHDDIVDTLSLLARRVGGRANTYWKVHKVLTR